jgi:hypothetical protein
LFAKAESKVTSYHYLYQGPPHPTKYYEIFVKGDKMKVYLPKGDASISQLKYDTVYIDVAENKAKAYCERERISCGDTQAKVVTASDYYFKSPFDWIKELDAGTAAGTQNVNGRNALRMNSENITVWIDTYSGLPILIKLGEDTKDPTKQLIEYEYKDLSINSVLDEELVHKTQ